MSNRHITAAVAAVWVLASCGGSSSGTLPTGSSPAAPQGTASANFVLSVPAAGSASAKKPAYVSPSTLSVGVSVDGASPTFTNISPTSPGCNGATPTNPYNCTITVTGPIGSQPVAITTYDQVGGAGNKLSANALDVTFVSGQNPSIPMVLSGVPHTLSVISASPTVLSNGTNGFSTLIGANEMMSVVAVDADNNYIVGPGAPVITVIPSTSGSLSVSAPTTALSNVFAFKDTAYESTTFTVTAIPLAGSGSAPITQTYSLLSSTVVSTFSGAALVAPSPGFNDGPSATARYAYPAGIAMANGNLYVSDRNNCRIRMIVGSGANAGTASTVAGAACSGPTGALYHPTGIAYDSTDGNFYVADFAHCQIQRMTPAGALSVIAGTGTCGYSSGTTAGSAAQFDYPDAITYDASANALFVSDTLNCTIREVQTVAPYSVSLAAGNETYCGAHMNAASSSYAATYQAPTGASYCYLSICTPILATPANAVDQPGGITNDGAGNLYVTGSGTGNVLAIAEGTGTVSVLATGFSHPQGIAYASGTLYLVSSGSGIISAINVSTKAVTALAGTVGAQSISFPSARRRANVSRRRRSLVSIPLVNGAGALSSFNGPACILYDAANNRLIVTDQFNNLIRQILL